APPRGSGLGRLFESGASRLLPPVGSFTEDRVAPSEAIHRGAASTGGCGEDSDRTVVAGKGHNRVGGATCPAVRVVVPCRYHQLCVHRWCNGEPVTIGEVSSSCFPRGQA